MTFYKNDGSIKRIQLRTMLYNTLNEGFGKSIANKMSANVVNTLESARDLLAKTSVDIQGG